MKSNTTAAGIGSRREVREEVRNLWQVAVELVKQARGPGGLSQFAADVKPEVQALVHTVLTCVADLELKMGRWGKRLRKRLSTIRSMVEPLHRTLEGNVIHTGPVQTPPTPVKVEVPLPQTTVPGPITWFFHV